MNAKGRVTLPIEQGMDDQLPGILSRLGADAVRNSDGTWLPEITPQLGVKVYETYFPARGQQEFAEANLDARPRFYLMSERVAAPAEGPLAVDIMKGYYKLQVEPDQGDVQRWWEVIDRTTGEVVPVSDWSVEGEGAEVTVTIAEPVPFHVYTVSFLAWQVWDSTQMYNYITNNWWDDETRVREIGYDARHPVAWEFMKSALRKWCEDRPEVDVVRFTTFFYHFTLVFNDLGKEKYVDWFGYSTSVNPIAMEAFEKEYGYQLRAEDFVDQGYYNSSFRVPSPVFKDWIEFTTKFVCSRVKELVDIVHEFGKEALMFLGDNWMGTEPYGELFASTGIDGVVGSVGSSATCRMISDIPGVKFTEGRFLPYFFPDVFREGGDPLGEANESWLLARRAIARKPLDRIGYGGYLSLATKFPDFMARIEQIADEFRSIHDEGQGQRPENSPIRVAILNAWGQIRTWMTHMVAHALWYKQIYSYLGVIEALAGLPFDLKFISFDDARNGKLDEFDVVLNVGAAETAFSGGSEWLDESLAVALRKFVHQGGGLIGVGEPRPCRPMARTSNSRTCSASTRNWASRSPRTATRRRSRSTSSPQTWPTTPRSTSVRALATSSPSTRTPRSCVSPRSRSTSQRSRRGRVAPSTSRACRTASTTPDCCTAPSTGRPGGRPSSARSGFRRIRAWRSRCSPTRARPS